MCTHLCRAHCSRQIEEDGKTLRRYWTNACQGCALKGQCTTGKERRISRWEHEAVLEAVQARLDRTPDKMRERRQTVEHPFGTIKSWMGATHFQMRTLKHVGTEMALHVLAYNMKRLMHILGVGGLIEAIRAQERLPRTDRSRPATLNIRVFAQPGRRADIRQNANVRKVPRTNLDCYQTQTSFSAIR